MFLRNRPGAGLRGYSLGGPLLSPHYSEPCRSPTLWSELIWGQANRMEAGQRRQLHGLERLLASERPHRDEAGQGAVPETWASASHLSTPTTVDTYVPFKSQPGVTSSRTFTLTTLSLGSNPNHCNEQFHHPLFMCLSPRLVWESSSKAGVYPYPSPLQCLA